MQVRAAVAFSPNRPLEVVTLELGAPGDGEVLVQMKATGLCHSDLSMLEGKVAGFGGFPTVLGHEGAGVVIKCGSGVTSLKPGDHVIPVAVPECRQCCNCTSGKTNLCAELFEPPGSRFSYQGQPIESFMGLGTFAEYSVIGENKLAKIRTDVPLDVVCYIGCGVLTGVGSVLQTAKVTPGSSVAVFGLGGIGLNVFQGAKIAGATQIIAIDINPDREVVARNFGATEFINPKNVQDIVADIQTLTKGGVDFSFECIGNTALIRTAVDCTNPGWGVTVSVGVPASGSEVSFNPMEMMVGRTWKGALLGGEKPRTVVPKLVDWYANGFLRVDELITHRVALEDINRGFDMMKSGEAIRTVVVYS